MTGARDQCASRGGSLATIRDSTELYAVGRAMGPQEVSGDWHQEFGTSLVAPGFVFIF